MSENIEVFSLNNELLKIQDRKEFYNEVKEEYNREGKISRKVKTIRLILMNSSGRIYLQKRSNTKNTNSGLYDKSVGGHVKAGDSYNLTVIKECAEELGFPASILSADEFLQASKSTDLNIVGIFKEIEFLEHFESTRISKDGSKTIQPLINPMYIGYYDGPIKFLDGESSGIQVFSLEELEDEMKKYPELFTEDIKFMIDRYRKYIVSLN